MRADTFVLSGRAQVSTMVPRTGASSLDDFLRTSASDTTLLGTEDYDVVNERLWRCRQPAVPWFQISIIPVFTEVIERPIGRTSVDIRVLSAEAFLDGDKGSETIMGRAMGELMASSSMSGCNALEWSETADASGWTLTGDIALTVTLARPRLLPMPRRIFERAGSEIIRSTCAARGSAFLEDVSAAYAVWSRAQLNALEPAEDEALR